MKVEGQIYNFPGHHDCSDVKELEKLARINSTPILILDCEAIRRQYSALKSALPEVDFFYAVKAFAQVDVINTLYGLGCGFDVASNGEIDFLERYGISPESCIHTHPIKKYADIERALDYGISIFVIDNLEELLKFKRYGDKVRLLLRVGFRSKDAVVDLARKFGCSINEAPAILEQSEKLGIKLAGISFHVGSQVKSPDAHVRAVRESGEFLSFCRDRGLSDFHILDIGGGFPVTYCDDIVDIEEFCHPLRQALSSLPENVRVIAEPGRFLIAPAVTSVSAVVGKARRGDSLWYYLDDGVYGSYSGIMFDHAEYPLEFSKRDGQLFSSVLAGPTCDSIDVIKEGIMIPELDLGDLVIGRMMGAYTASTATDFNTLPRAKVITVNRVSLDRRAGVIL